MSGSLAKNISQYTVNILLTQIREILVDDFE